MIDGAGFSHGVARQEPSCIIDIAPTILTHLGLPASGMDGRPLQAARGGRDG
jgi:arylsulfatase A-like enzyme